MNLVIVESPAKAKTIERYLGSGFRVLASFGHVRDLPLKTLGVDTAKNYEPEYGILPKAKKIVSELKSQASKASAVYLATDLDREGEAISWHLAEALKLKGDKIRRIVFNEITKNAITKAIENPRGLDINLIDAQQARRVLDRLVGYKLSPLLWKKVRKGLSAGRVQSVAVRLVVEREREIEAFKPVEYWILGANLSKKADEIIFPAYLVQADGKDVKKYDIKDQKMADEIARGLEKANYKVLDVEKKESIRRTPTPFTTSALQIESSRKLGFSPKQTMTLAQSLYEDGHITYMRTDSTNLATEAVSAIRSEIEKEYGKKYLPDSAKIYQTKVAKAQEAHEAIRPTHFENKNVTDDRRGQKLYELIWKRTMASQMNDAIVDVLNVRIEAKATKTFIFLATGETVRFDGFLKVYAEALEEDAENGSGQLPLLAANDPLDFHDLIKDQKFTQPPARYSEAMLVKKLESMGIGRPSTYAPTLETIQQRGYVILENKRFKPEEVAMMVNDLLVKNFPEVVDYEFTAKMENEFDDIADGKLKWTEVIDEFYKPFEKDLKEKAKDIDKAEVTGVETLDEKCPECGAPLVTRLGRFGKFIACSAFPKCKYSRPLETKEDVKSEQVITSEGGVETVKEATEEKCEKCGGKMILKEGRFGKFLACENYPKCKNTKTVVGKTGVKCPKCEEGDVIMRRTKKGRTFWGCSRYPDCDYATWEDPNNPKAEQEIKATGEQEAENEESKETTEEPETGKN